MLIKHSTVVTGRVVRGTAIPRFGRQWCGCGACLLVKSHFNIIRSGQMELYLLQAFLLFLQLQPESMLKTCTTQGPNLSFCDRARRGESHFSVPAYTSKYVERCPSLVLHVWVLKQGTFSLFGICSAANRWCQYFHSYTPTCSMCLKSVLEKIFIVASSVICSGVGFSGIISLLYILAYGKSWFNPPWKINVTTQTLSCFRLWNPQS